MRLYQDNAIITNGWRGNDLVSLLLAVPLLAIALGFSRKGSTLGHIGLVGMLFYTLYNYAFYLFGSAFNNFFLLYVLLLVFSMYGIIFALISLGVKDANRLFRADTPIKPVSGFMIVVSFLLGGFHTSVSLDYVFTEKVPELIAVTGGYTNLIAALDLTFVVPLGLLAGFWLWRQKAWGYVLALVWNIKGFVYMAALSAASTSAFVAGATESMVEVALWAPIGIGCLVSSVILIKANMKR